VKDLIIQRTTKSIEQKTEDLIPSLSKFPEHIIKTLRDKTIDLSVVPYMRSRDIGIDVHNLKPDTLVYAYLDNEDVSSNISGSTTGSFLTTDTTGKLSGITLSIPTKKFLTGKRTLRFIDNTTNSISTATTIAETPIFAQGIYETRDQNVSSVRPIIRRKQTVNSSAIPTDVSTRKSSLRTSEQYQWTDPLAQTFFVDESENPRGVFLQNIRLWFAKKDNNLPITVQIRPTKNGYPHPSAIVPFSEVVLYPDNVNVNTVYPETETSVDFTTPIFLEPGEYAICLTSNSSDYQLYTATVGETELTSGDNPKRIQKPVYGGSLFRPQNTNIAEPDYTKDLKFTLTRCKFVTTGTDRSLTLSGTNTGTSHKTHLARLNTFMLSPSGTGKSITYSHLSNAAVDENTNITLPTEKTIDSTGIGSFSITFTNSNDDVSPVFDTTTVNLLHVENEINNNTGTQDDKNPFGTSVGSDVRYITKRIELPFNNAANDFHVDVDMIKPENTQIEVYIKGQSRGSNDDFDNFTYHKLSRKFAERYSGGVSEVITESFHLDGISINSKYSSFAVKICLYTSDKSDIPVVKSLRAVALEH